ncbi:hypothetical protein EDB81DRAFT_845947 [Dactylonectria macrodidyma]|uniref:Aminoacyl-transfer RNA synthetases class-II family profile domain-containing protein n=1 Tax=Dactylonectria macrodidyma TaxID=307937 RepID=A0A9P9E2Y8_9HYPO|nr:hypothetical protein EDB81DRAFT_845947 [Dactylonectria macrodidyma]
MATRVKAAEPKHVVFDARVHAINSRSSDGTTHLTLRDEGHFIGTIIDPGIAESSTLEAAVNVNRESLVRVYGSYVPDERVRHSPNNINGLPSVRVWKLTTIGVAIKDLRHNLVSHGAPGDELEQHDALLLNERLNSRVLDLRVATNGAIIKPFSGIYELTVEYLTGHGFDYITTPSLIGYKVPGDDDYFEVPYFNDRKAYLTQTGELYLGQALSAGLERIFEIHTVFCREAGPSTRHLTEFTALEIAFALEHDWLEKREKYRHQLALVRRLFPSAGRFKLSVDENGRLPRVTFRDAKRILREELGFEIYIQADLSWEEEKALGNYLPSADSIYGASTDVYSITHHPKHLRPYNVQPVSRDNEQPLTYSFDITLGGQEAASGFQVINDYKVLRPAMAGRNPPFDLNDPQWQPFLSAYEAGAPLQGGSGIGLNRLLQSILGLPDIRETTSFPRDATRLEP